MNVRSYIDAAERGEALPEIAGGAFESVAGLASYDLVSGQRVPAVSPVLYDMIYLARDRAFLSRIADGPMVENTQFSWWERQLKPQTMTAVGAITTGDTAVTVTAGQGARITVGAILVDEDFTASDERMIVTAIATDTLTVTRGYGGTTATNHASGWTIRIVGMPAQEMSSIGLDLLRAPSEFINYTQIFRRDLKASRSSQGVKTFSGYALNAKRLQEKLLEIQDELEQTAIYGVSNSGTPLGSDTQLHTTGGLLSYIPAASKDTTAYTAQTPADLKDKLDTKAREIRDAGGDANFVMAGGTIFGAINDLDADQIRLALNDGVRGAQVSAIRTKFGAVLDLVYDRWLPPKYLCVGDYRKVQMRLFSNGGNPHIEELAKTKDGQEFMLIGELGFQVENGTDAFRLFTNIVPA